MSIGDDLVTSHKIVPIKSFRLLAVEFVQLLAGYNSYWKTIMMPRHLLHKSLCLLIKCILIICFSFKRKHNSKPAAVQAYVGWQWPYSACAASVRARELRYFVSSFHNSSFIPFVPVSPSSFLPYSCIGTLWKQAGVGPLVIPWWVEAVQLNALYTARKDKWQFVTVSAVRVLVKLCAGERCGPSNHSSVSEVKEELFWS